MQCLLRLIVNLYDCPAPVTCSKLLIDGAGSRWPSTCAISPITIGHNAGKVIVEHPMCEFPFPAVPFLECLEILKAWGHFPQTPPDSDCVPSETAIRRTVLNVTPATIHFVTPQQSMRFSRTVRTLFIATRLFSRRGTGEETECSHGGGLRDPPTEALDVMS